MLDPADPDCPFVPVEGEKQIRELLAARTANLLILSESRRRDWPSQAPNVREMIVLPDRLVDQLSPLRTSQGIVGFFDKPDWGFQDLTRHLVFADGLQDPGNLGTILRTAAASGLFSLVTAPGTVSCFNAKVVRASAGYLFSVPFVEGRKVDELRRRGYTIFVADAAGGSELFSAPLDPPLAVVIGREGGGPSSASKGAMRLRIPMAAGVESLNAAVASAVIMYEVVRRRGELEI